jgi:hypothetical protein
MKTGLGCVFIRAGSQDFIQMNSTLFCTAPQKDAIFEHMNSSTIPSYLKDLSWRDERPPIEYSRVGCATFNAMSEVAEDNQIVQPLLYHEYCDDYPPQGLQRAHIPTSASGQVSLVPGCPSWPQID